MCLLAFAYNSHADTPLVVCSNRDEFYQRPTLPMHWWPEMSILAGRDEQAGGTWLGLSRSGRFAAVTNFRDLRHPTFDGEKPLSRGHLVSDFLGADNNAREWSQSINHEMDNYGGFNLLIFDGRELLYINNYTKQTTPLAAGVYALSNHLLDSPWPKVDYARTQLRSALKTAESESWDMQNLASLLSRQTPYPDDQLPSTGVPPEWERLLSSPMISAEGYGTRASTAVVISASGKIAVAEKSHQPGGDSHCEVFTF